jgi:hypothetical protein
MIRFIGAFVLAAGVAVAVGACDDSSSGDGYAYGGGGGSQCSTYTTCDTCTPANGCGWCFNRAGGMCASDPDQCSSASEFTWTWDQTGCPDLDASVSPLDAGTTTPEATTPDASAPASDSGTTVATDSGSAVSEASTGD